MTCLIELRRENGTLRDRLEQAERENESARNELREHLGSPIAAESLVDGIRQLAQIALTNEGNVATLTAKCEEQAKRISRLEDAIERQRRGVKGESRRIYRKT